MNGQPAVTIVDKTMLPKSFHKMADPRSGCADHLCQGFLLHSGDYSFGSAFLAIIRQQQENPSQPLFAGVEKLVYEILFVSNVA